MLRISASKLQREFGRLRRVANREAVIVTSHGRDDVVLLSAEAQGLPGNIGLCHDLDDPRRVCNS